MFISTGPDGFRLFASSDSTIFFLWTASSVTPTLNNPFYAIDKKGLKPCPHYDRSRQRTYCTINDLEVYTEYEFSLMLCDQPLLDNRTRCTSPSRATKRTRPQRMFLLGANLDCALHRRADFKVFIQYANHITIPSIESAACLAKGRTQVRPKYMIRLWFHKRHLILFNIK